MNCFSEFDYSIFVDGEMPREEARRVERHLAACARCRDLVAALRTETQALAGVLRSVEQEIPEPAVLAPSFLVRLMRTLIPAALFTLFLSFCAYWLQVQLPTAGDWLNPMQVSGRMNLISALTFYLADKGAAMLASFIELVTVLMTGAILVSLLVLLWQHRKQLLRPGLGVLVMLLLAIPGFSLEKRSSKTLVTVGPNETINDTLLATGDEVRIEGTINGDLITFARRVDIRGTIKGNLMTWAQRITVSGTIEGNICGGAQSMDINGQVLHNVYTWTQFLNLPPQARIGGELIAGGADTSLEGKIERDATVFSGVLEVGGDVGRDLTFRGGELNLSPPAHIQGNVNAYVQNPNKVHVASGVVIGGKTETHVVRHKSKFLQGKFYFWRAVLFVGAMIIGWLAMVLVPGFFRHTLANIRSGWRSFGLGFAVLIATPIAVIILAITLIGIPLALITAALYIAGLYLSKIFVGAVLGWALLPDADSSMPLRLLGLAIGLIILLVVTNLPYAIGAVATFLMLCFGLGGFAWQLYRTYRPLPA